MLKLSRSARSQVNNNCYQSLYNELDVNGRKTIDKLFVLDENKSSTQWDTLKQEPKKAKSKAIKEYLKHLRWIQSLIKQVPSLAFISAGRKKQYILEARALHANSMKELKPIKRYALAIIFIHGQQQKALDDVAKIIIKTMQNLHSSAQEKLNQYHLKHVKLTEKLLNKFRDVLLAYKSEDDNESRFNNIKAAISDNPSEYLVECEEHLAYAGNNYAPFMLSSYKNRRSLLFNCIDCL